MDDITARFMDAKEKIQSLDGARTDPDDLTRLLDAYKEFVLACVDLGMWWSGDSIHDGHDLPDGTWAWTGATFQIHVGSKAMATHQKWLEEQRGQESK